MLGKFLIEQFRIVLHRESKETPVYRLQIAKNGPKLQPPQEVQHYDTEEEGLAAAQAAALSQLQEARRKSGHTGPFRAFTLPRATLARLSETLSTNLDRPVVDQTGITGEYSFRLEWTPVSALTNGSEGASIFT